MKKHISLILIFAIIISLPVNAFAKGTFNEDANAIATAAESVVMLTCYDNKDEIISTASGFLAIEDGLIITNFHVINHEIGRIVANTEDGMYFDVDEIVCYDSSSDIAILRTKAKTRLDLLKLGDSDALGHL